MCKYIDEFDIDLVNQALTFNTTDMHIQGTCDLFTTKPIGADRKLYKTLNKLYNPTCGDDVDMDGSNGVKSERQNSNSSMGSNTNGAVNDYELNPQFVQLKKRSFSYSYATRLPIQQKLIEKVDAKSRSKSFTSPPPQLPGSSDSTHYDEESPFGPLSQSSSRKLFGYLIAILNSTYPDHDFSTIQPTHFKLLGSATDLMTMVNNVLISVGKSTGLDWVWETINTHIELDNTICFQFEPQDSFLNDFPGVLWCNMYFMFNKKKKRVAFLYFMATVLKDGKAETAVLNRRRNSKIGTLDEQRDEMGDEEEEYDFRYSQHEAEPNYEDVFEDDEEVDAVDEEEEKEDDFDDDYEMDREDLANENQDDEDLI